MNYQVNDIYVGDAGDACQIVRANNDLYTRKWIVISHFTILLLGKEFTDDQNTRMTRMTISKTLTYLLNKYV